MSGTPIKADLRVSEEIRAAARAARRNAERRRVREVSRRTATPRAQADAGEQSERMIVVRMRMAVLRETAATGDAELVRTLEAAQSALAAVRHDDDLRAVEAALDVADRAADLAVERHVVQHEVVTRVAAALPGNLRLEPESVRPAAAGGVRLEALRPTGDRLGIELRVDPAHGSGSVQFDVAHAGLQPRPGVDRDRCAVELAAVAQLVPRLAAVGLQAGPLEQAPARTAARRRAGTRTSGAGR